jgi:hypothetical protein
MGRDRSRLCGPTESLKNRDSCLASKRSGIVEEVVPRAAHRVVGVGNLWSVDARRWSFARVRWVSGSSHSGHASQVPAAKTVSTQTMALVSP